MIGLSSLRGRHWRRQASLRILRSFLGRWSALARAWKREEEKEASSGRIKSAPKEDRMKCSTCILPQRHRRLRKALQERSGRNAPDNREIRASTMVPIVAAAENPKNFIRVVDRTGRAKGGLFVF